MKSMDDNELISALADGQLRGPELEQALDAACRDPGAAAAWHAYHVVGDALRSAELAGGTPSDRFLARLNASLAREPAAGEGRPSVVPPITVRPADAANDGSFRWKLVAGVASFAAVAAVGWSVAGRGPVEAGPQLAQSPSTGVPASGETVLARTGAGVMIRDPKLDEFLAAHRQLGGASALQMPAGFLRGATSEAPSR